MDWDRERVLRGRRSLGCELTEPIKVGFRDGDGGMYIRGLAASGRVWVRKLFVCESQYPKNGQERRGRSTHDR